MQTKYPIEYKLTPEKVDEGSHWVTLTLKNIGTKNLTRLNLNLHSLDTYCISVFGTGKYLSDLKPNETETVPFQISAIGTGKLYVTIDGEEEDRDFFWFSPNLRLEVGREAAQLKSVFTMTAPYPPLGEALKVEATIMGLEQSEGLNLQFWTETPSGRVEELADIETKRLSPGENATYTSEITPKEEGLYTIYSYLYDGNERIGSETDMIWVRK